MAQRTMCLIGHHEEQQEWGLDGFVEWRSSCLLQVQTQTSERSKLASLDSGGRTALGAALCGETLWGLWPANSFVCQVSSGNW